MSTRSKRKSTTPIKTPSTPNRVENSWILLLKDELFENNNFTIIGLPHPASGKPTKYCLDNKHNKIFEVVTFSEPHRSWFINETVKSDGSIQMVTPVNPLFLVLPRLKEQCSTRAIPLDDLLSEKGFDKIIDFVHNLDDIADLKGPADLKAYKYNEEKTLKWLEERVCRLAKVLREKNIHVTSGAVSATFVTSNSSSDHVNEEFYLKYAHGIISEYLQDDITVKLEQKFDFKPDLIESVGNKRKSEAECNESNKKIKCEPANADLSENALNTSDQKINLKKQKPLSAKEKARQKAASGTKTLSDFFFNKK